MSALHRILSRICMAPANPATQPAGFVKADADTPGSNCEETHRTANLFQLVLSNFSLASRSHETLEGTIALNYAAEQVVLLGQVIKFFHDISQNEIADWVGFIERFCASYDVLLAQPRGAAIAFESEVGLRLHAPDPDIIRRLTLVLSELLVNAIKHAVKPTCPAVVQVNLSCVEGYLVCCVSDGGSDTLALVSEESSGADIICNLLREVGGGCRWVFGADRSAATVRIPMRLLAA